MSQSSSTVSTNESGEHPRHISEGKTPRLTLDIAGASIFGALSIVVSLYITPLLPRVPAWFIAYFDPVSIIWITAFLIFGIRCGMITFIIGTIGLIPFDPTNFLGPAMKFAATVWMIIIPYFYIRLYSRKKPTGYDVKDPRNYMISMTIAWLIRLPVMLLFNIFVLKFYGLYESINLLWLGNDSITGMTAVIITVVALNTLQALGDALIPYLLVYSTKIYDLYELW